jgi:hypothetical protein
MIRFLPLILALAVTAGWLAAPLVYEAHHMELPQ